MNFDELRERALRMRQARPRGRYAPSPTGPLHLGNARSALLAWLETRLLDGVFILRMEDLDRPRTRPGSAEQIIDDLRWMGLDWDEGPDLGGPLGPYVQSERDPLYAEALDRLHRQEALFPCFCSRKDIAQAASAPHRQGGVYPGTCRDLTPEQRLSVQKRKHGKRPAWRYHAPMRHVEIEDAVFGLFEQDLAAEAGDFVVRRADGLYAYQLAVVVDDGLMGVTHVARGADLLDSTPRQIELFEALDLPVPQFCHLPLLLDARGERLAKRDGSDSIAAFREAGGRPETLVGQLASSAGLIPVGTEITPAALIRELDVQRFCQLLQNCVLNPG